MSRLTKALGKEVLALILVLASVLRPCYAGEIPTSPNPVVEEHSGLFKSDADRFGEPGHVFHPSKAESEPPGCPQAIVFRFASGAVAGLCGEDLTHLGSNPPHYRVEAGQTLDLLTKEESGQNKALPVGANSGFAGDAFEVTLIPEKGLSVIEELEDRGNYYPFWRQEVECTGKECVAEHKTCALKLPANLHPEIVAQVQKEKRRTLQSWSEGDDFTTVIEDYSHRLLLRVLTGDTAAAKLLMNFPLETDAAPAEVLATYQSMYEEAKTSGCVGGMPHQINR